MHVKPGSSGTNGFLPGSDCYGAEDGAPSPSLQGLRAMHKTRSQQGSETTVVRGGGLQQKGTVLLANFLAPGCSLTKLSWVYLLLWVSILALNIVLASKCNATKCKALTHHGALGLSGRTGLRGWFLGLLCLLLLLLG